MPSHAEILQLIAERKFDQLEALNLKYDQLADLGADIVNRQREIQQELQQLAAEDQVDQQVAGKNSQQYSPKPSLVAQVRQRLNEMDELERWHGMCQVAKLVENGKVALQQFESKFPEWQSAMRAAPSLQDRMQQTKTSPLNPKPMPSATKAYTPQELQILQRNPAIIFTSGLAASAVVQDARQASQGKQQDDPQQKLEDAAQKLDDISHAAGVVEAASEHAMTAVMHSTLSATIEPVVTMAIGGLVKAIDDLEGPLKTRPDPVQVG